MRIEVADPEAVVKEAFWLAWQASRCVGAGFLQNNPTATKEDVWDQVFNRGDYPGGNNPAIAGNVHNKPGKVYGDYVFGRMMKVGFEWDSNGVSVQEGPCRSDYQSWCGKYPTRQALIEAAIESLSTPVR